MAAEISQLFPMFEWVVSAGQHMKFCIAAWLVLICAVRPKLRVAVVVAPPLFVAFMVGNAIYESREMARAEGYDLSLPSIRDKMEEYIETGEGGHPGAILASGKYAPTFGYWEFVRYVGTNFFEFATHTTTQDHNNVHEGYNKGHDWFEATLGEPMFYSSAFFMEQWGPETQSANSLANGDPDTLGPLEESLDTAQLRKMEYITNALGVKPGMKALDIGSGWGRFVEYLAQKGAEVTGVVAAHDLAKYARRLNKHHGDKVKIIAKNFYDVELPKKSFDVISAVEMSEHAGVANFNVYLKKVHSLLKDQGTFYIQCSGLQRGYAKGFNNYHELIWGIFMEQHVFPGADSSTPMGWILEQLEKAGFEVQAAHNMGISYSRTLHAWQKVWETKKSEVVQVYGERAWRRWHVFLAWCVHAPISRHGGSTVNFITATKSGAFRARYDAQNRLAPGQWVSPSAKALGQLVPRQGDGSFIEKCNSGGYNTSAAPCELGEHV
jgi:cyclopropane fatty-acyl-phospholipid synthase-like methyltransferase